MSLIKQKITKINRLIAGFLILVSLGNYLDYVPLKDFVVQRALAKAEITNAEAEPTLINPVTNETENKLSLIAILVEDDLMDDFAMRSRIMTYADSTQKRMPHSKSLVIEVNKEESTFRIASLLEKLYFEGVDTDEIDNNPLNNDSKKEDDNQLSGVVLIGEVPMPVVHEKDGSTAPSIYPYTDFYRKQYVFNHESDQFEVNDKVSSPTPEVWHGLIVPPSQDPKKAREELMAYFDKNYEYTQGNPEYTDFKQRVLYANFPEMEKQMNFMDYKNYGRYIDFMEEMIMNRFNKHLLKELIKEVSTDLGTPESPIMDDASIDQMYDVNTEVVFKKYAYNLAEALRVYRSGINEAIQDTGRWTPNEVDSPESLIAMRDEYAKLELKAKQLLLEKKVDDFIKSNTTSDSRKENIVTLARLNVKAKIYDQDIDNKTFSFQAYFDGQLASEITNANQCGIKLGQARNPDLSVLENNSVLVEANRMYNPATLIRPPSDDDEWSLKNTYAYQLYGGCVFNNSMIIAQTGNNPAYCIPEQAQTSIFDVVGSIEVPTESSTLGGRCDVDNEDFKIPTPPPPNFDPFGIFNDPLLQAPDYTAVYKNTAAKATFGSITLNESLEKVIEKAYVDLLGSNPEANIIEKGSYVIRQLITSGQPYSYTPKDDTTITLNVSTETKLVDTLYFHVEPTNETIKAIKHIPVPKGKFPEITTPSTPSDGIRYISLAQNGIKKTLEYLNLFRIKGNNFTEISDDLEGKIKTKQQELDQINGNQGSLFLDFLTENSSLFEPITWKTESVDQKLENIIPKYINRDSWMPVPPPSDKNKDGILDPQVPPTVKPNGYEVLHIVADGDAQGYQFGLNRAMMERAPKTEGVANETNAGTGGTTSEADAKTGTDTGSGGGGDNYLCGDPAGVEIWEWFDALQCWIDNEILPAQELFGISQMCSNAPIPPEEEEGPLDAFEAALPSVASFDIEMKRKSMVPGQKEVIRITAQDAAGNPVLGYIDKPIHLELSSNVGSFSSDEVYIFTGEREVEFTANKTGLATLTATMEGLPDDKKTRQFSISVLDSIGIDWIANETIKNGRSEFSISAVLVGPNGGAIQNINDSILLAPEQPADGGFENNGQMQLLNGRGTIRFQPTPGKKTISIFSKDPYITGEPLVIHPTGASASQIILRAPAYFQIGKDAKVEVLAADSFGFPADDFNKKITLQLSEESKKYATLVNPEVVLTKGRGTLQIKGGRETADITLTATSDGLKGAEVIVPLLARVDSESWKVDAETKEETYPQTLFASFVGFPAGDFTQENYFGGTHLFQGKTEAVYSFMSAPTPQASLKIAPNNLISTSNVNQTVLVEFPGNHMLLQAFDRKKMQTLISRKANLSFDSVEIYEGGSPALGAMSVEILDTDHYATPYKNGYQIRDLSNEPLVNLQPNQVKLLNSNYKWLYQNEPEFNAVELLLTDGSSVPLRLILNFKPETLKAENLTEINTNLNWLTAYGGKSTNDPTGLTFFERDAEVPEVVREEFYGFKGEQKYLSLFASGTNIGEAVKFNLPSNAILLGDPTIRLKTKSRSSLNYNSAIGEQIYQDPENQPIVSSNHFNFNNDGVQDVAILTKDGRVRLLEGGHTEPPYIDRGDIGFLVDGGIALETFDFKNDHYEDLLVATDEGRLAILNNDREVITRTDQTLNIGKKIYKLLKGDMDQDGYDDLVILDSRGDIYIFYYNPATGKFPENGMWIDNKGFTLKLGSNLSTDLDIRYSGMSQPSEPGANVVPPATKASLENYEGGGTIDENAAQNLVNQGYAQSKLAAKDPAAAIKNNTSGSIPKLPWPEGDQMETYFAPIESVGALNVIKSVSNKDRPGEKNVDLEETLTYRIEINSGATLNNVVIADTVPDSLTLMPDSITCIQGGCQTMESKQNSIKLFLSNLNLSPGQKTVISYDVLVSHTPEATILLQKISEPNQHLTPPASIIDQYLDIMVSPPYNTTSQMILYYSTGPRTYQKTSSNDPKPSVPDESLKEYTAVMAQMETLANGNFSASNPPPAQTLTDSQTAAAAELTGSDACLEDVDNSISCLESGLDSIGNAISNFQCIGGGCFPMPFNYAFLVPSNSFPLPVFAFPTTLPVAGIGPVPFIWPGSILGAASIPGPIMSQLRFYLSPTLTGGIGMAMCWGPYPQAPVVPPPVFPVPYPPPIGNCLVTALPADKIWGGLCKKIGEGFGYMMDQISAGVNKVNSEINDINNDPNNPVNIEQGGADQGAGGLEISLGINLGNSQKFDPPAQGFSNMHIPSFDSIGGVISSWFDRQALEIENKLLTLPTLSVYLPDVKSLFTLDFEKTEKRFEQWKNTMSGSGAATAKALGTIDDLPERTVTTNPHKGDDAVLEVMGDIRGNAKYVKDSKALEYMGAIETQASIYNLNALEGLYDVASTLPLIKLTEKPIQFDIPWLSAAEIQAWITEAENWVIYYEREYNRVKDKWEAISCQDQPDENGAAQNAGNCVAKQVADAFGVSFQPMVQSVKDNIEMLQAWLAFPKQLAKFKAQLADYIKSVACYLDVVGQMMGGWMATLQQQVVSWAELILTIAEIINNIKDLFDVFTSFDESCEICTNERYANFGWWMLLGLVLPDLPVIQFPKIPDIVLDMSNMDAMVDIELPILNLRTKSIPLPPLPYLRLPDFPTFNILLQLPALPVLPGPPTLPNLPALPPIPTIDLPTLPPPPKLPDVGQSFEAIIPLVEKVLEVWCIMKKALAPVPEMMLNDEITLLTNRPAYLIPLDILKLQLPNIALFDLGFNEIRIETIIYLGLRVNVTAKPIEDWVDKANKETDSWIKYLNDFYKKQIIEREQATQGWIDEQDAKVKEQIAKAESGIQGAAQGAIDDVGDAIDNSVGEAFDDADAWLRDQEAAWDKWAEEQEIGWTYEEYYTAVNRAYEKAQKYSESFKGALEAQTGFLGGIIVPVLNVINQEDWGKNTQEALDIAAQKLKESETKGPTEIEKLYMCLRYYSDCRENYDKYFGGPQANAITHPEYPIEPEMIAQNPQISEQEYAEQILESPQGQQVKGLLTQISDILKEANNKEPVDYTVLKEELNVPDYIPTPRETTVDKIQHMRQELLVHSDQLLAEANNLKHVKDLNAIAGVAPQSDSPYQLAEKAVETRLEPSTTTSAVRPANNITVESNPVSENYAELKEKIEGIYAQGTSQSGSGATTTGCNADFCLPDTTTGSPVPVIPFIDFLPTSETLFMPNGNLVYSDGTGLYLKRDLTIDDSNINTETANPRRFKFNEMMNKLIISSNPKEAINMLQSTFTENGASTFTWLPVTHPDLYGYGIELERAITGFDANKQNNQLADTKILLLPPNEEGLEPEVTANGQAISYGTLVTSLTNEEEAAKKFGVSPKHIVTGASEVRFPTISNALIKVDENKAVFFDRLEGSAYNLSMENGYYHIKMTWFDQKASTATYNHNEMLAPQIYAGASEPIDVSQTNTYYTPIFKEKTLHASDIFVDLAGAYHYYWYIDPDNNIDSFTTGNTLTIPAQDKEKTIKVKLVASQSILDENFKTFEKLLEVKVYIPAISLDSEKINEGIVTGNMTPIPQAEGDDLSDIPFSVFRKRQGTWKNLGILHADDPNKTPTTPALDKAQNYYSTDTGGAYYIEGFDLIDPSPLVLKDNEGNAVAEVDPTTGLIYLHNADYDLQAVPGGTDYPTHIAIIKKETGEILGNVYYIAESTPNVTIKNDALSQNDLTASGTTIGDANTADDITAAIIPKEGPSFSGGAAIFNEKTEQNIALVDKDGTIRMMKAGYKLIIKNKNATNGHYIFRIVTESGSPIFDVFIQADFENLKVDTTTSMNSLNTQIGLLPNPTTAYAQSSDSTPVPEFQTESDEVLQLDGSPFPDVSKTHPYFNQILELYKSRVISGYEDGSFKPDQKLTRAEFVKIALGVSNCVDCTTPNDAIKEKYLSNPFPDVFLPSWYFYCISIAKELGMVTGYGDGFFRPDRNISRAEAAAVLLRQSGIELTEAPEAAYKDVPDYAWYVDYVYTAVQIGLIKESFGFVNPDEEITRGEFAFMAAGVKDISSCRLVDTDNDSVPDWWEMTHNMDLFTPDLERSCPCYDSPWTADTDGDGVKDVCDLDIDNDGILNPLCILTDTGEIDLEKLAAGTVTLGEPADNCIFDPNEDQADYDSNGVGNLCEPGPAVATCECIDNPNRNDIDNDGIRDVCDNDIDNDGIPQPICVFDDSGLLDRDMLDSKSKEEGIESDNCIFVENTDQQNLDKNDYGDVCEPDETDLCPQIPEDMDGVDDEDGCPEVTDNFPEKEPGSYVSPGELCGFVDFATDMANGDVFMTGITDLKTHEIIFSRSTEVKLSQ